MASLATRVPPPILALASTVIVWLLGRVGLGGPTLDTVVVDAIGVGVALGGLAIAGLGLREFRRADTTFDPHRIDETSALVTSGPYRFTRNPMYVGLLAVLVGIGLVLGEIGALVIGAFLFVAVLTALQIRPEEAMMVRLFGAEYEEYRRRVRRWL